ncbi:uncharacterized protein LOC135225241 [Macrobrachium nipponense]|uniref:uncharacterized protein LOC135225241 n=1 Tax=Macrobrachium nipponense TaxID=159736 RepID=UPI0030C87CCB
MTDIVKTGVGSPYPLESLPERILLTELKKHIALRLPHTLVSLLLCVTSRGFSRLSPESIRRTNDVSANEAISLLLLLFVVTAVPSLSGVPVTAEDSLDYCQRSVQNCRLRTDWKDVEGERFVNLNVSCFCESDEPEDVWEALEEVSHQKCTDVPMNDDFKVNHSSIHITGCNITKEVFPVSVMDLARRTDHLEFVLNQCPYVRFGHLTKAQRRVPQLTVSFKDSKLSGLPRGWLLEADKMNVKIERCDIPIVESKAASGFTKNDDVSIDILNSNISTVKQLAFELPPSGRLVIKDSRVTTWSKLGFKGGSEVTLSGVKFGRILVDSFNLHGVKTFNMTECNVAELSAEAVTDTDKYSTGSPVEVGPREASIKHNIFLGANGEAFVNLCKIDSISWQNNTFLNLTDAPPRLQSDMCETKRNWKETVVVTGMNCMACEDFAVTDEQSCAFYRSGFCTSCVKLGDDCTKPLMPYVVENCKSSHPEIVNALTKVCEYDPDAPVPSARSLRGNGDHNEAHVPDASSLLVVVALYAAYFSS